MIEVRSRSFSELVGFAPRSQFSEDTHGTTVLALRCKQGVLMLADRRATAGNLVMYDNAEKIEALDDHTLIALSGSYARSLEICRFLRHSFKYYRRMVMNEMSHEGKLMEISRALANNLPAAMQGIGAFLPIVATYDVASEAYGVYFFDGAGARFQNTEYACAGSGSERIRGIFEYLLRARGPFPDRTLEAVLLDGLYILDIAADLDSATGGFSKTLPSARILDKKGSRDLPQDLLRKVADQVLSSR